jgi:predicted dehydrogenase
MSTFPATPLRFGIVGAGAISQGAAGALAGIAEVRLVGIADPHAGRAGALAAKHGATAVADLTALLGLGVDAVYIAAPNALHADLAVQALDAGVHVLLDKPFAMNVTQAERVATAAARAGRHFMLGMNQRFSREGQRARALIAAGRIGTVYHVRAGWLRRSGSPKIGTWFTNKDIAGGGALLDIGVHVLDLALWAMDRFDPVTVSGQAVTRLGQRGLGEGGWGMSDRAGDRFDVDDFATALIRFADGATLTLEASWALHMPDATRHDVLLHGTEGALSAVTGELCAFGAVPGEYLRLATPTATLPYPHACRFRNFVATLLGTEAPCVTLAQALTVQRIIDAIYQSSATGREVVL